MLIYNAESGLRYENMQNADYLLFTRFMRPDFDSEGMHFFRLESHH